MKVKFKFGIRTYSGTVNEMTYGSYRNGALCIGREYVYPKLTQNNYDKGAIVRNLAKQYHLLSPGYLADLKTYAERNGKENVPKTKLIPTAFALFLKMMYAWYETDPTHIDLSQVTLEDCVTAEADVCTIAEAVEAELLPYIRVYDDLTNGIL